MTGQKLDSISTGQIIEIPSRSGRSFTMEKGQQLTVIDPRGQQVCDLLAFNSHDLDEVISSGRTIDYASRIYITTGDPLYSNRSNVMLKIVSDSVGRHDFLFTPCSKDTFRIKFGEKEPHQGCFGNLAESLEPFGIAADRIPIPFNIFMNVSIDPQTGQVKNLPPISKEGDHITFEAAMDLTVALTACSAPRSNAGTLKPIHFKVE